MKIDKEKCIGCRRCISYCPDEAIVFTGRVCKINEDLCFECGTCLRMNICPVNAIFEPEYVYEYPRSVRKFLSDPATSHKETNARGRGTEEVKTNDVSNRFKMGEIGIGIELGRPTVGVWLSDLEKMTTGLAKAGFNKFEEGNPCTFLIENKKTGELKKEVLSERVLSVILEFKISEDELEDCLDVIYELSKKIDSVFTMEIISRLGPGMIMPSMDIIKKSKFQPGNVAKINIGIGRATNKGDR